MVELLTLTAAVKKLELRTGVLFIVREIRRHRPMDLCICRTVYLIRSYI